MVDTNIHVYVRDAREPAKQAVAAAVLGRLLRANAVVVSAQILGELFVCLRRERTVGLSIAEAALRVRALADAVTVLPVNADVVTEALRGVERHGMPYFDAQIWAAARLAAVPVLLTEDGPSGTAIEGVRFVNPFADDFDLDALLAG